MLQMVMAHTWEEIGRFANSSLREFYYLFGYTYAFIGPAVLMICLGTNLAFGKEKTPGSLARQGVYFLGVDLLLNLLRFGIHAVVLALLGWDQ